MRHPGLKLSFLFVDPVLHQEGCGFLKSCIFPLTETARLPLLDFRKLQRMTVPVPVEAVASSSDVHRAVKIKGHDLLLNLLNGLNGDFSLLAASFGATAFFTQKFSDPSADLKNSNHC